MGLRAGPITQLPRRRCSLCGQGARVISLALCGRRWLCPPCLREVAAGADATLHHLDLAFRYGWLLLRSLLYAGLIVLAHREAFGRDLLTGVLVADVSTWAIAAWFDLRMHRFALAIELASYLIVGHLWLGLGGRLTLPADTEGRAMAWLGFGMVFAVKITAFAWRLLWGERD